MKLLKEKLQNKTQTEQNLSFTLRDIRQECLSTYQELGCLKNASDEFYLKKQSELIKFMNSKEKFLF